MLLSALCDGDAARFGSLKVRFSSPVYMGDTLRVLGGEALGIWQGATVA